MSLLNTLKQRFQVTNWKRTILRWTVILAVSITLGKVLDNEPWSFASILTTIIVSLSYSFIEDIFFPSNNARHRNPWKTAKTDRLAKSEAAKVSA